MPARDRRRARAIPIDLRRGRRGVAVSFRRRGGAMTKRLCLTLVCALAPLALATGCGGSSSTTHTTTTGGVSGSTVQAAKRDAAAAYTDCVQATKNSGLTATERATLGAECADIKSGNASALRADGERLCVQEASLLPASERATMQASCKAKVK
jgi:hypothetical protein